MKRLILLSFTLFVGVPFAQCVSVYAQDSNPVVELNDTNFPDDDFRNLAASYDSDGDGWLSEEEIAKCERIQYALAACPFKSLEGIRYFTSLNFLYIGNAHDLQVVDLQGMPSLEWVYFSQDPSLEAVRVSGCSALKKLYVAGEKVHTVVFDAGCTSLEELQLIYTSLQSVDVSEISSLKQLLVNNNQLSSIKVGANNNLTSIECQDNQLTSIDVSACTNLTTLLCSRNQLTSLDVSANSNLTSLNCSGNKLSTIDVSANSNLHSLDCSGNNLSTIDVSANSNLTSLNCSGNNLSTIDVSANSNLTSLNCSGDNLSTLDVSPNTNLTWLYCDNNQLTTLDLTNNKKLERLSCSENQLTSLTIRSISMELLNCSHNQFQTLDLSSLTDCIDDFDCSYNQLTSIKMPTPTSGNYFYFNDFNCSNNRLTSLQLKNVLFTSSMSVVDCSNNQLNNTTLNSFISSMYDQSDGGGDASNRKFRVFDATSATEGNIFKTQQVAKVKAKNWLVQYYRDGEWTDYEGFVPSNADCDLFIDNICYHITGIGTVEVVSAGSENITAALYAGLVDIPESIINDGITYTVNAIAAAAFDGCTNLKCLRLAASTPPAIGTNNFACPIVVPNGYANTYKSAEGWSNFASLINNEGELYRWTADQEEGGEATATDGMSVGYANSSYSTIRLNGKTDFSTDYITIELDKALSAGDIVCITAYRNKNAENKQSGVKMKTNDGEIVLSSVSGLEFVNIDQSDGSAGDDNRGTKPNACVFFVPENAAGSKCVMLTRSHTQTNLFITKISITPMSNSTLNGDVNGDGDVDIADAVCIVNHVVGKPNAVFNITAADANNDGDVDIADAVHIVNYVVGKINALARNRF